MNSTSIVLVNTSSEGIPANNNNVGTGACLSDNGGLVAFTSSASNLVTGVSGNQNLYVKNTISGAIQVASSAYEGTFGDGNSNAQNRCFLNNGEFIVFESSSSNLGSNDTNGKYDIFIKNLSTGSIARLSNAKDGTQSLSGTRDAVISEDGKVITFRSNSAIDTQGSCGIFVVPNPL